jgi:hypothetical protein
MPIAADGVRKPVDHRAQETRRDVPGSYWPR